MSSESAAGLVDSGEGTLGAAVRRLSDGDPDVTGLKLLVAAALMATLALSPLTGTASALTPSAAGGGAVRAPAVPSAGAQAGTPEGAESPGQARPRARLQTRKLLRARGALPAPRVRVGGRWYRAVDPYRSLLPGTSVDWDYWRQRQRSAGSARRAAARAGSVPVPVTRPEQEPADASGRNDRPADAERIDGFAASTDGAAVAVRGRLARAPAVVVRTREDQGSIRLATPTGVGPRRPHVTVSSRIGDGPHGRRRSGRGDFDFFRVNGVRGQRLIVDTRGSRFDTVLAVYNRRGRVVAFNDDDDRGSLQSEVRYRVPQTGRYWVMVGGFGSRRPTPVDPFRSGTGRGAGAEGRYLLRIFVGTPDQDAFAVRLDGGDVLGGSLTIGATSLRLQRPDGVEVVGSTLDASSVYPAASPLPGGGATVGYVAEEPGWYTATVRGGTGAYRLLLEAYRPGAERSAAGAVQTVFLDFDGERLNTGRFFPGAGGVSTLSPLRRFLGRWGLTAADEDAVIDAVTAAVTENLRDSLLADGPNDRLQVRVLTSRDDPDPFGRPDVSRVVIGGTIAQSGLPTIGIAESIDPGNFAHEESALVLLDEVSSGPAQPYSFNRYLTPDSDRVAFVGRTLGVLVSHELGHVLGSFHTDNANARANLMDAGGVGWARLYGVGPDRVGGTADDADVDFGEDAYAPFELFTGQEDTTNNSAWALLPGAAS